MAVIRTAALNWRFYSLVAILVGITGVIGHEYTRKPSWVPNPPTQQECRVHIEAALRDYWDRQPSNPSIERENEGVDAISLEEVLLASQEEEELKNYNIEETTGGQDEKVKLEEEESEISSLEHEDSIDDESDKEMQVDEKEEESEEQDSLEKSEDETKPEVAENKEEESEEQDSLEKSEDETKPEVTEEKEEEEEKEEISDYESDDAKEQMETEEGSQEVEEEESTEEEKVLAKEEEEDNKIVDEKSAEEEEEKVKVEDAMENKVDEVEDEYTPKEDSTVNQEESEDVECTTCEDDRIEDTSRTEEDEVAEEKTQEDENEAEEPIAEEGERDEKATEAPSEVGAGMEQELPSEDTSSEQSENIVQEKEKEEEQDNKLVMKKDDEEIGTEGDDEEELTTKRIPPRSRRHIDEILGVDEIGTQMDKEEQELIQNILNELKKMYISAVKPLENIYKFREITTRQLGDAEIYSTPQVLFLGPWSAGKSSIINYLLGIERSPAARKEAPEPTDTDFTVITYGNEPQKLSGTELAADWSFASVQKFGQSFLDHFKGVRMNNPLLKKVTLLDTPGINENRRYQNRGYPFNDVFQWFIDHADAIYVVFDPFKLEIGSEMEAILDQLKGREAQIRFILNKADSIRRSELMKVVGQLFWNLSPLMGSSEAPVIYAVSLMSKPFQPWTSANFLMDQERALLNDLREVIDKRVENRIAFTRRHAVRVRNHAKMVDCYLATYYKHKGIFSNKKKVADDITEHPNQYNIYQGLSSLTNISRYDLPDPLIYRDFFRLHALYEFKPLASTCSYFMGCPLDKLDISIAYDLPELLGKYKKKSKARIYKREEDADKGR
ncbi:sarcalumenin-like isoform X2 [Limulus polyphemus]|uniref:Sarcalumenin-like isoform X2 n=1 Tax=Limulus polyphemus TaxID=6850 RepID=A0ABM1BS92_LIMPO|nr:sarcalumenin-like isoform X2 [Limulus polyphemus]